VEFTWQAIGRRKGYEERPIALIPDPDAENARLEAEAQRMSREEDPARMERSRKRMKSQYTPQREGVVKVFPVANER